MPVIAPAYALSELRRRRGRTLTTALGLAAGVGLVMSMVGVSNGLSNAQNTLLSPLSSVGTDIIVTRTIGATTDKSSSGSSKSSDNFFSGGGSGAGGTTGGSSSAVGQLNTSDQQALAQSNDSVLTDLAKLGPPGTKFTHDFFLPGTLITFPQQAVTTVSGISGVTSAVPEISLQGVHESGTVPKQIATFTSGGGTINVNVAPKPLTQVQEISALGCFTKEFNSSGLSGKVSAGNYQNLPPSFVKTILNKCLPPSYLSYLEKVQVPLATEQQVINPPTTDTNTVSYSVAGVDPSHPDNGVITRSQVTAGHWFGSDPAHQLLVNAAYANSKQLRVGGSMTINGISFSIVGIVAPTLTGDVADLYFDLPTLQSLATQQSRINEVLVEAANASEVPRIAAAIQRALPGAQVLTAQSLANQVSGSLSDAHSLASSLGTAVAILVLLASFAIAILLTLSSITKRTREIGSLRAMGWSRGLVVRQIMAETLGISIIGAALGILLGVGLSALIGAVGPRLQATTSGLQVGASTVGSVFGQSNAASAVETVHLTAPLGWAVILLGVGAALLGGLLAGGVGGWRAARLAPAMALRDIG